MRGVREGGPKGPTRQYSALAARCVQGAETCSCLTSSCGPWHQAACQQSPSWTTLHV